MATFSDIQQALQLSCPICSAGKGEPCIIRAVPKPQQIVVYKPRSVGMTAFSAAVANSPIHMDRWEKYVAFIYANKASSPSSIPPSTTSSPST